MTASKTGPLGMSPRPSQAWQASIQERGRTTPTKAGSSTEPTRRGAQARSRRRSMLASSRLAPGHEQQQVAVLLDPRGPLLGADAVPALGPLEAVAPQAAQLI